MLNNILRRYSPKQARRPTRKPLADTILTRKCENMSERSAGSESTSTALPRAHAAASSSDWGLETKRSTRITQVQLHIDKRSSTRQNACRKKQAKRWKGVPKIHLTIVHFVRNRLLSRLRSDGSGGGCAHIQYSSKETKIGLTQLWKVANAFDKPTVK